MTESDDKTNPNMRGQVTGLCERTITCITFEWFFAGMRS